MEDRRGWPRRWNSGHGQKLSNGSLVYKKMTWGNHVSRVLISQIHPMMNDGMNLGNWKDLSTMVQANDGRWWWHQTPEWADPVGSEATSVCWTSRQWVIRAVVGALEGKRANPGEMRRAASAPALAPLSRPPPQGFFWPPGPRPSPASPPMCPLSRS